MTSNDFINKAIDLGQRNGVGSLDLDQRMVFLIAEAQADSDMNGIDTFLSRYTPHWISEAAAAFFLPIFHHMRLPLGLSSALSGIKEL